MVSSDYTETRVGAYQIFAIVPAILDTSVLQERPISVYAIFRLSIGELRSLSSLNERHAGTHRNASESTIERVVENTRVVAVQPKRDGVLHDVDELLGISKQPSKTQTLYLHWHP